VGGKTPPAGGQRAIDEVAMAAQQLDCRYEAGAVIAPGERIQRIHWQRHQSGRVQIQQLLFLPSVASVFAAICLQHDDLMFNGYGENSLQVGIFRKNPLSTPPPRRHCFSNSLCSSSSCCLARCFLETEMKNGKEKEYRR